MTANVRPPLCWCRRPAVGVYDMPVGGGRRTCRRPQCAEHGDRRYLIADTRDIEILVRTGVCWCESGTGEHLMRLGLICAWCPAHNGIIEAECAHCGGEGATDESDPGPEVQRVRMVDCSECGGTGKVDPRRPDVEGFMARALRLHRAANNEED